MLTRQESNIVELAEVRARKNYVFNSVATLELCRIIRKLECQNTRWRHAWAKHEELEAEEQTASE